MAALKDKPAIRENNSVIPSLVFDETDQYSAFNDSAIAIARFSIILYTWFDLKVKISH